MARLVLIDNEALKIVGVYPSGLQAEYAHQCSTSRHNDTRLGGTANRDFSVYTLGELAKLHQNTIGPLPKQMSCSDLCKALGTHVRNMEVDETDLATWQAKLGRDLAKPSAKPDESRASAAPRAASPSGVPKPAKAPSAAPARPKAGSTTGKVWDIADRVYAEAGNVLDRNAVIAACEAEGINASTAATQFAKWKRFTLS